MRAATPSGDTTSHVGLDRHRGEGNQGWAAPGVTAPSKSGNQVHRSPEEEKNHKDSLVPALGRHWKGWLGLQRPRPLHPSSPRELAWHGHSLGSPRVSEGRCGRWGRRNSTCSPAAGGPQEQPATRLVHMWASLAAKGLPHYLKTASKQKITWTSWVTGIAHRGVRKALIMPTCSPLIISRLGFLGGFETYEHGLCLTQSVSAPGRPILYPWSLPQVLCPHHRKLLRLPSSLARSAVTCFSYSC